MPEAHPPALVRLRTVGRSDYHLSAPARDIFNETLRWSVEQFNDPGLIPSGYASTLSGLGFGGLNINDDFDELCAVGLWERSGENGFVVTDK